MVEEFDLVSTNLENGSYDPETQILMLTFQSGHSYEYAGVPQGIVEGLKKSGSPGSYFHRAIKMRFAASAV